MTYSFSENQWGEKFIEELNRADFISMKSEDFLDNVIDVDLCEDNTLYLVIGSDSGLLLRYLKKKTSGRGSRFVVIEHDDVFPLIATEYRGLLATGGDETSSKDAPISLHSHSNWQTEVFNGSERAWLLAGKISIVESHSSASDYARFYMPILRDTRKALAERKALISITISRKLFTKMQFRNAADSTTPLKSDLTFGNDKTAIVLGGGPSLDLHLEWVKANRDKLFILSVSRLAKKLQEHQLRPDILVSVDPLDYSYEVCKAGVLWTDVPLAYNYHVSAKLLQQWQGPTYYLGKRLPWHSIKQSAGNVGSSGPTVSHVAVHVAAHLGFSRILMTGVDLCFTQSVSTHSTDSPEQMIQKMPTLCNAQVVTYSGRIAGTSITLKNSAVAMDNIGAVINREKPVLYNLSYEAARCESIAYLDYLEIELPDKKPDFSAYTTETHSGPSQEQLDELSNELTTARHAFKKMRSQCKKAKKHVAGMHTSESSDHKKSHSNKLTRLRKQLQKDYTDYLEAIIYDNGTDFVKTQTPIDFEDMTQEELIDWGQHYYDLVENGAQSMMDYIDELHVRIQLRSDEQHPDADVRELAKRWREDETPGRILRWKQLYWQQVKPKDRAWVQRAVGKFRATLNEPATSIKDYLTNKNQDIENVMRSLVFLSERQSQDELQAIESKLDGLEWPYSALKLYTSGLVHELQQDHRAAIVCFQGAIDACSLRLEEGNDSIESMQRLIEDCLVRMTSGYMGEKDYASATTTLGMLCEMLPSYVVSYAKLLDLCGQNEFAIELLESYLKLYPESKSARFVLKRIKPEDAIDAVDSNNPEYRQKISGAMQAIMGENPDKAA